VQAAEARQGLRGRARIAVDSSDGSVSLRGKQVLVLERPAHMRVEILGLPNQTLAVLVTDGDRFELFNTQNRSYETGEVTAALLWEQAHLALTPAEAIDLLLGAPAIDPELRPAAAFGDAEGRVRLDLEDLSGRLRRRELWRAEFRDYALLEGVAFPHVLDLEVATGGTRAEISLRDVELNPELSPDIFRLRAPQAGAGVPQAGAGGSSRDG
jgi:outer membrane lipoprotein-sorting protein